mgnify:CR=1 FL=1
MRRVLDPVSLRLFVAVCEEGNIAMAGDREAIVPSAISKRVAALEDSVGIQLLVRSRHGIKPTPAGEALLRQAREILSMMEQTFDELAEYREGIHGSVRVLASLSVIAEGLPDDLARFLGLFRDVRVSLEEKISAEIVRGVREGRADMGICWNAGDLDGLDCRPYRSDRLAVVAYPGHPLAELDEVKFVDALDHELINVQPGSIMQQMLGRYAAVAGKSLNLRIQVANFESAIRLIKARLGVAILPLDIASPLANPQGLRVIPLSDPWATRQFVLVTRSEGAISTTTQLLISFLGERSREAVES